MAVSQSASHSATVKLALVVDGEEHRLSQVGPDFLITSSIIPLLTGQGKLVISIDGREQSKTIEFKAEDFGSRRFRTRVVQEEGAGASNEA